jgi:hypothetical protein
MAQYSVKKPVPPGLVLGGNQLAEGREAFTMERHTGLWKALDTKNSAIGYGAEAGGDTWCWYESWLVRVREGCQKIPQSTERRRHPHPSG